MKGFRNCLHALLLAGLVLALPLVCHGAEYGYPLKETYAATIMGTPEQDRPELPKKIPLNRNTVEMISGLKMPDVFYYDDDGLYYSVAFQNKKAPLIFIIPGTGSNDRVHLAVSLMKLFYQAGYHVVSLPNPTHPNFINTASRSHVPGDLTSDAADLYAAMAIIMSAAKADGVEVSDTSLVGYSLGGTQAAFVAKQDEEQKLLNFRKVLMINPAVSLYTSICNIESLLAKIPGGPRKIGAFYNSMMNKVTEFYQAGDFTSINDQFLYAAYKADVINKDEAGGLIGLVFRINLAGMIFSSDVMTNGGYIVPKNKVLQSNDPLDTYLRVGIHLNFPQYFDEYFYPYFKKHQPELTRDALIEAESLRSIEGYLKSTRKIGVMTNRDDFILSAEDVGYLMLIFGDRAQVYPYGGHLGNAEYRDNMAWMVDFMKNQGGAAQ